jgi:hypothetical protein
VILSAELNETSLHVLGTLRFWDASVRLMSFSYPIQLTMEVIDRSL